VSDVAPRTAKSPLGRLARLALPFVVSAVLLAWVLSGVDLRAVVGHLTPDVALVFVPALLIFIAVSLSIEALCLVAVVSHSRPFRDVLVAARIKAASYPLGLVNYALGAGATAVLLRRRTGMTLSEAAGSVLVIGLFDLGCLIGCVLVGIGMMGAATPGLQAGIVVAVGVAIVAGFAVLRAPMRLGALDRIRELEVFHDARTLPIPLLVRLGVLRLAFVGSFIALVWTTLHAFGVRVPPLDLIVDTSVLLLVSALPIAVAGLGTGQVVFVGLFQRFASAETLIAASLTLSFGMIVIRAVIGLAFAREFTAEALAARHEEEEEA
jgi:hypothetical protein